MSVYTKFSTPSLQAGMDDFLAKPVVPEKLFDTLLRWIPAHVIGSPSQVPEDSLDSDGPAPAEEDVRSQLALIEWMDIDAGLHSAHGRWATYVRLLKLFASTHGNAAQSLRTALEAGNLVQVQSLAHALKGSAAALGITSVSRLAAQIELPIKQGTVGAEAEVQRPLAELEKTLPALVRNLCKVLG